MSDKRFFDFDQEIESAEPIRFKVRGQRYEIPGEVMTDTMLRFRREVAEMGDDGPGDAQEELGMRILSELMGEDNFAALKKNSNVQQFEAVLTMVMRELLGMGGKDADEGEDPKEEAAEDAASPSPSSTSSSTGPSSSPTTAASGLYVPEAS